MEDLQDKIIELMDLFDGEVTTADKIDRPQQALDREMFEDANKRFNKAGGGMLVQPSADGSRPGYDGRKNRKVSYDTENKIVREYNKYLVDEITSGDLSKSLTFKSWLKENKTPAVFEKTYNAHSKNLLDVKPASIYDAKVGLVKTFVERANEQGQFVEKKKILQLIGRDQTPGVKKKKHKYIINIRKELDKLDSREDKVHKALNRLFNNELVFVTDPDFYKKFPSDKEAGSITRMLIQETGLTGPTIRQHRATWKKDGSKVPFFSTKKGKEQLKIIEHMNLKMGKVGESTFDGFNFNDLMEYGANSKKGGMYYKSATGSDFFRNPNNVVRDFVIRHFDNNSKFGGKSKLIKVFKKGTNTEIKYEAGKRLTDFDFTYKGKRYGSNELAKEYLKWTRGESTPFKEVYDNHKLYTDFLKKPVNIGDPSVKNIGDLFRLAGHQGMAIEHGSLGGVAEEPFKNLKLLSSRANSEIGTILQYYKNFPNVQKLLVNEFVKELPVNENYIDALAKNEIKIAKDMLKNGNTTIPMTYNQAAKNILTNKNIKNFSPIELRTVSKSAFGPTIGYKSFVGVGPEKFENITTQNQLVKLMGDLAATENRECEVDLKSLIQRKAAADGGRIGFKFGTGKPGCDKLAKQIVQKAIQGEGTPQQRSIVNKLIRGGANFLKDAVNPVELLKLRNYVGPQALGFFAAYEAGVITDDVLRMGKPLNEAVASNWLTKSFLPYTEEFAKQENLLKSGTLTGNQRLFALDAMKYNKLLKEVERIEGMEAAQLTDQGGMGMIDGTPMVSQAEIDKAMANVTRIAETIDPSVLDPRSAKAIENKAKMDEMIATRRAKKEFSPIFGFDKLKNRAIQTESGDYLPDPLKIDLSPITYKNVEDFKPVTELPAAERIILEEGLLPKEFYKPMDRSLSNFYYKDSDKTVLEDELEKYNRAQRFKEAFQQPGILGANEKFATGGRAGFREGTPQSILRKGILKLIDDSVKSTPKDTTSALDKLIKKTLNEDLFDKKDRIIDQINISETKKRKNLPYNMRVFEEPKNLDFYDSIIQSNFRTKTGPYFDRIRRARENKAGGGLLKQAGDRSGPPPESGPMSQGLQGLMKRGMKI